MDPVLDVLGLIGLVLAVGGGIALVGNRRIKAERSDFLEKQRDDYRDALEAEREECKRQLAAQGERISRLEGQLEHVTSQQFEKLAERMAERVGVAILRQINERGVG